MSIAFIWCALCLKEQRPHQQADKVRHWKLQWMWPRDGRNQTLAGAGESLAAQYRDAGLDMWHEPVTFPDAGYSVEAGLQMMLDRMRGERWKVFRGQNDA